VLCLAENQIHDPAAAHVLARLSAMVQDVGVVAAGFCQSVGEDRKAVKGAVFVDRRSNLD
jgi:hypothetical protein